MTAAISVPFHTDHHPTLIKMRKMLDEIDLKGMLMNVFRDRELYDGMFVPLRRSPEMEESRNIVDEGIDQLLNGLGVPVELYRDDSGFNHNTFQPSETARRALEAGLVHVGRPDDERHGHGEGHGSSGRSEQLHEDAHERRRLLPPDPTANTDPEH